jgi:hypothetical protein
MNRVLLQAAQHDREVDLVPVEVVVVLARVLGVLRQHAVLCIGDLGRAAVEMAAVEVGQLHLVRQFHDHAGVLGQDDWRCDEKEHEHDRREGEYRSVAPCGNDWRWIFRLRGGCRRFLLLAAAVVDQQ